MQLNRLREQIMYKGSCLCTEVHVDIEPPIESIIHCHCSKCRKNSGTAYSTNGFVLKQHFHILKGADMLSRYETAPGKYRYFCSKCGSPIIIPAIPRLTILD